MTLGLTLTNIGDNSTFRVDVIARGNPSDIGETPSRYTYTLSGGSTSQSVSLVKDETKSLGLIVMATGEVTEADTLYLQITMTDESSSERSNFYNLQFTGTTVVPVDRTQVVRYSTLILYTHTHTHTHTPTHAHIHTCTCSYRSSTMEAEDCTGL